MSDATTYVASQTDFPNKVPRPKLSKEELSRLRVRRDWRNLSYVAGVVVGIAAALLAYMRFPGPFTFALAFIVIAALQHHLSIIQHEAVHFLLFKDRRWNEFVGSVAAYPIGFTMGYRRQHFDHHFYLGTDKDPDLANYAQYPNRSRVLLFDILKALSGVSAVSQFGRQLVRRAPQYSVDEPFAARGPREWGGLIGAQVAMFAMFWSVGHGAEYLYLWLLPLVTLTKTLTHLRNIARHVMVRDVGDPELSRYRTTLVGPIERFFFAPMHFNYHAEHHFYPMIPWHNLPEAHNILSRQAEYARVVDVKKGVLRFVFGRVGRPA